MSGALIGQAWQTRFTMGMVENRYEALISLSLFISFLSLVLSLLQFASFVKII
jgi:FtsH-binding integral membrane protein